MTEYKVGDKLRYRGECNACFTQDREYEVFSVGESEIVTLDNYGDDHELSFPYLRSYFELVTEPSEPTPVEASPTVIELLANISRRLYEAEQTIKEQAYEINELYRSLAEQAVADRG